jgi:hypothetical protein
MFKIFPLLCVWFSYVALDYAMAETVACCPPTTKANVQTQGFCGGQSGTGTAFSQVFRFSHVSIIVVMLHTHSVIYCQHYIILATDSLVKTCGSVNTAALLPVTFSP